MNANQAAITELNEMEKAYINKFVETVKARGQFWTIDEEYDVAKKIAPFLHYLTDEELQIVAQQGKSVVAQAVADFLIPRIEKLNGKQRIELGRVITYHRVWTALVETPLRTLETATLEFARSQIQTS